MSGRSITQEEYNRAKELLIDGYRVGAVADKLGRARGTLSKINRSKSYL